MRNAEGAPADIPARGRSGTSIGVGAAMRGIHAFTAGLGIAGAAATGLALSTDRLQGSAHDVRRRAADAGEESARGKSDRFAHNVDGGVRVGLGAIGLLSIPTAAVAASTRRPVVAAGALGGGLGATGAALLAGNGGSRSEEHTSELQSQM